MDTSLIPVYDKLQEDVADPLGKDEVIRAFSASFADQLTYNENLQESLSRTIQKQQTRGPFPPWYVANFALRLFQQQLMDRDDYPLEFMTPDKWTPVIEDVFADPEKREFFNTSMLIWNVQSNVAERYAGPKLVALLLQGASENVPMSFLDIGCSRNHGLAWLNANLGCSTIAACGTEIDVDTLPPRQAAQQNPELTERVNELIQENITLDDSYGVDCWPISEPELAKWQKACSSYPMELLDKIKQDRYNLLEEYTLMTERRIRGQGGDNNAAKHIHFSHGDITEPNLGNIPPESRSEGLDANQKFDQAISSTVWYQLSRDEQKNAFNNIKTRLKKGGKFVLQDFCSVKPLKAGENPVDQLTFHEDWQERPYSYQTIVYDSNKPELGFQLFARWINGRCSQVQLAKLALAALD